MKYVFMGSFAVAIIASWFTWSIQPDVTSDVPVLYWVTDPNPARELQIATFDKWLAKDPSRPRFEMRVDTANMDHSKMLIQGVSGVASDIIGHCGDSRMYLFQEIGLLEDVTESAKRLNYDPSYTWQAIVPDITIDGRQYGFPCNVYVHLLWVNKATFKDCGMDPPPKRWTFEEFEELGTEFVKRANEGKTRQDVFFINGTHVDVWRRSLGLDIYNETLTRCILNDPRNVQVLDMAWRWTYEARIIPSRADIEAFATQAGYGGATLQLFNSGNYAMFMMGRYALIQLREFAKDSGGLELAVSEPPHGGFPNTGIGTRAAAVFVGGKHKELARYFQAYLASEDYNMNIVLDADALPPNPKVTETEEYLRPKDYPNEWGCHEAFSDAAREIGIAYSNSPFVLSDTANRIIIEAEEGAMTRKRELSPRAACAMAEERVNEKIALRLEQNPRLRPLYEERLAIQERIDRYRREGKAVPLEWISNPFYRKYYVFKGWAE